MSNAAINVDVSEMKLDWTNVKREVQLRRMVMTEIEMEILEMVSEAENNMDDIIKYIYPDEDVCPSTIKRFRMNLNKLKKKFIGKIKESEGTYYLNEL
jgi:molybdenum cofactor biosynthesis enzyme